MIVGAGGAGLMVAWQLVDNTSIAVISKLSPRARIPVRRRAGLPPRLGTRGRSLEMAPVRHREGGTYLVNQDAAEVLAREAIDTV